MRTNKVFFIWATSFLWVHMGYTVHAQSEWRIGVGADNGISFVHRLYLNRGLNNIKTVPTSAAYYYQIKLFISKMSKSEKGSSNLSFHHRVCAYNTKIYDNRYSITQGSPPILSKANYSYALVGAAYFYQRYVAKIKQVKLFAGVGISVNYYYKNKIKMNLTDGKHSVIRQGKGLDSSFPLTSSWALKFGGEFSVFGFKHIQAAMVYENLNYLPTARIPNFSILSVGLDVPVIIFKRTKKKT